MTPGPDDVTTVTPDDVTCERAPEGDGEGPGGSGCRARSRRLRLWCGTDLDHWKEFKQ